jgi:hypothetical protein
VLAQAKATGVAIIRKDFFFPSPNGSVWVDVFFP